MIPGPCFVDITETTLCNNLRAVDPALVEQVRRGPRLDGHAFAISVGDLSLSMTADEIEAISTEDELCDLIDERISELVEAIVRTRTAEQTECSLFEMGLRYA